MENLTLYHGYMVILARILLETGRISFVKRYNNIIFVSIENVSKSPLCLIFRLVFIVAYNHPHTHIKHTHLVVVKVHPSYLQNETKKTLIKI